MAQFKCFENGVQVNGETVLAIVNGMGVFKTKALEILKNNGIDNPQSGQWYSQQDWLNAFKEIAEKLGDATLYQIGTKIPESAQFPPEIDSIEKALSAIDIAYHMNHQKGEIGNYQFTLTDSNSGKFVCNNPYPCEFDRGIIYSMSQRFKPAGSIPSIKHDDSEPCRKKGNDSCTYLVTW